MYGTDISDELTKRFKLICKKCGSDDVVIDIEESRYYSEETGADPGRITIGCNACKLNDFQMSV